VWHGGGVVSELCVGGAASCQAMAYKTWQSEKAVRAVHLARCPDACTCNTCHYVTLNVISVDRRSRSYSAAKNSIDDLLHQPPLNVNYVMVYILAFT
jgi:hypothetical protein